MNLVLLGMPGVGKGTQAQKIAAHFLIPKISTGDMLRSAVAQKSELGIKASSYMTTGLLVPDELVISLILERISQPDCNQGYILDGFPRTVVQAQALEDALAKRGASLDWVISIEASEDLLVARLVNRRQCGVCQETYHLEFNPPLQPQKCDRCGGELIQREDDKESTIRSRFAVYQKQTFPLVNFYEKKNMLKRVNGNEAVEVVFAQLLEQLK